MATESNNSFEGDFSEAEAPDEEMKTVQKKRRRSPFTPAMVEALVYIGVFAVTVLLFFLVKPYYTTWHDGSVAQGVAVIAIGIDAFVAVYLAVNKKLNAKTAVILMFIAGTALRIGYMLYTPASTRQQDTFSSNANGHEAYAWTIFSTGSLPSTNDYQFYHPPLNALIQAGFMKIVSLFNASEEFIARFQQGCPSYGYMTAERYYLYQTCQILSVMYSVITMAVQLKILKKMNFKGMAYAGVAAIVIFFPRQIQFAGMLNNDGLSYLFAILALYYIICWWKGGKGFGYIIAGGFAVGLGMMAKLSSATICIPLAGVFIYEFVRTVRKREGSISFLKMVGEYAAFIVPAAAIGLWFQVYAYVKFGQEFGFVFSNLNSKLYTGDYSVFQRFFFSVTDLFYLYCDPFEGNYNLFNYSLHSAIFGEFSYWQGEGFAGLAVIFAYVAVAVLAVALVYALYLFFRYDLKDKSEEAAEDKRNIFFTFLLVQSQALSEIYFYVKMPYACTMDFRYIMPMILGVALTAGLVNKRLARQGGKFAAVMTRLVTVSFAMALLCSSLFYMVCI
ncbi:MAG: hypothetical protein LUD27_05870 [Clostridia bacterium]|nr:hypothetical protein [Clostridia bacterium]